MIDPSLEPKSPPMLHKLLRFLIFFAGGQLGPKTPFFDPFLNFNFCREALN